MLLNAAHSAKSTMACMGALRARPVHKSINYHIIHQIYTANCTIHVVVAHPTHIQVTRPYT